MSELSDRQRELCEVALQLLVDVGYDRLTMDQVAAQAHASKATLYRHWDSKAALVADAIEHAAQDFPADAPATTGTVRGDLHALVRRELAAPVETELLRAVLHACLRDPELAALMRDRVITRQRTVLHQIFARAIERGEIDPDSAALSYIEEMFAGPWLIGDLLRGEPADEEFLMGYVDSVVLPSLGGPGAADRAPGPTGTRARTSTDRTARAKNEKRTDREEND